MLYSENYNFAEKQFIQTVFPFASLTSIELNDHKIIKMDQNNDLFMCQTQVLRLTLIAKSREQNYNDDMTFIEYTWVLHNGIRTFAFTFYEYFKTFKFRCF